ncbi:hypothetical protein FSP39_016983 [Pinctada imbricata]|uniref:OTU domain-containing protein n=1 Tax=Pinctada imbricata TaxID=66713 RepID=A0AA88YR78_PINIB|nr:hypothetical protein FSP39_016983 [Pinctada imbricata]
MKYFFSYRVGIQKSSKQSPFDVMFARPSVLEFDSRVKLSVTEQDIENTVKEMQCLRDDIESKVKSNVKMAQHDQVTRSRNRNLTNQSRIRVGQKVIRYNVRKASRKGSKMEKRWMGPYIVEDITPKGVATLKSLDDRTLKVKYNVKQLKVFKARSDVHVEERNKTEDMDDCVIEHVEVAPKQHFNTVDAEWQKAHKDDFKIRKFHKFSEKKRLTKPKAVENIKGDGNCYFRCLSFALTGSQNVHERVRDVVVTFMTEHTERIEKHFGDTYLNDSNMDKSGTWATEAEILASAAYLNTDIYVYAKSGKSYKWLKYPADMLSDKAIVTDKSVYLANISGSHFDFVKDVV